MGQSNVPSRRSNTMTSMPTISRNQYNESIQLNDASRFNAANQDGESYQYGEGNQYNDSDQYNDANQYNQVNQFQEAFTTIEEITPIPQIQQEQIPSLPSDQFLQQISKYSSQLIVINVRSAGQLSTYLLPKDLLISQSKFFHDVLTDPVETVDNILQGELFFKLKTWSMIIQWLYTGHINIRETIPEEDAFDSAEAETEKLGDLIDFFLAAEWLGIVGTFDTALGYVETLLRNDYRSLTKEHIREVYEGTGKGHGLRKLVVRSCVQAFVKHLQPRLRREKSMKDLRKGGMGRFRGRLFVFQKELDEVPEFAQELLREYVPVARGARACGECQREFVDPLTGERFIVGEDAESFVEEKDSRGASLVGTGSSRVGKSSDLESMNEGMRVVREMRTRDV